MEAFVIVWRHKEQSFRRTIEAARVPMIDEEVFLKYSWLHNNTSIEAQYKGIFRRVTAVRWKPANAINCKHMYAEVYLHYAESYEPKEEII